MASYVYDEQEKTDLKSTICPTDKICTIYALDPFIFWLCVWHLSQPSFSLNCFTPFTKDLAGASQVIKCKTNLYTSTLIDIPLFNNTFKSLTLSFKNSKSDGLCQF